MLHYYFRTYYIDHRMIFTMKYQYGTVKVILSNINYLAFRKSDDTTNDTINDTINIQLKSVMDIITAHP